VRQNYAGATSSFNEAVGICYDARRELKRGIILHIIFYRRSYGYDSEVKRTLEKESAQSHPSF